LALGAESRNMNVLPRARVATPPRMASAFEVWGRMTMSLALDRFQTGNGPVTTPAHPNAKLVQRRARAAACRPKCRDRSHR
jgi:hypothetical protein